MDETNKAQVADLRQTGKIMKNSNLIISKLLIICILLFFLQNLYTQNNVLIFEIKNAKKNDIKYPVCLNNHISDCIDSTYKHEDTLFIVLIDTREFYKGKRDIDVVTRYITGKRKLKIPIQDDLICDFIVLKTFDLVCDFIKIKRKNRYKLVTIKREDTDFSNKIFIYKEGIDVEMR